MITLVDYAPLNWIHSVNKKPCRYATWLALCVATFTSLKGFQSCEKGNLDFGETSQFQDKTKDQQLHRKCKI